MPTQLVKKPPPAPATTYRTTTATCRAPSRYLPRPNRYLPRPLPLLAAPQPLLATPPPATCRDLFAASISKWRSDCFLPHLHPAPCSRVACDTCRKGKFMDAANKSRQVAGVVCGMCWEVVLNGCRTSRGIHFERPSTLAPREKCQQKSRSNVIPTARLFSQ